MRLKDAYSLPSIRLRFRHETERSLLRDFSPGEPTESEASFAARAIDQVLQFLPIAEPNGDFLTNLAEFLLQLRLIARDQDYGIGSYSLGRALVGDLETCSARLYESLLQQWERLTSNNATAFHSDERLQPQDAFGDAIKVWRVRSGATMLALLDLSQRAGHLTHHTEDALWKGLSSDDVESILGAFVGTSI
jgi:hypothetical protein